MSRSAALLPLVQEEVVSYWEDGWKWRDRYYYSYLSLLLSSIGVLLLLLLGTISSVTDDSETMVETAYVRIDK